MRPSLLRCAPFRRLGLCLAMLLCPLAAAAQASYGPLYAVSAFEIDYALDHPRHIDEDDLLDLEVGLTTTADGYVAPRPVDRTVRMRLSSLPRNARLSATAIQHINQFIVSSFNRRGFNGVIVTVPDIEEGTGQDLRAVGDTTLRLRVWTGRVSRVTTLADGERYDALSVDQRTNHGNHTWIRERAPVQPGGLRGLLDVAAAEDYAARLSRHPGRRVDVELAPGTRPGASEVNLRVAEHKPWRVYAQYSNTGTSATTKNRQRFGFVHTQLTGRDDVLSLDYGTGDFEDVHSYGGSYEAPFSLALPALRGRISGRYSEFDASEVGFTSGGFQGEQLVGQADLLYNVFQQEDLFVDVSAGARFHRMEVDNDLTGDSTEVDFWVPRLGVRAERNRATSRLGVGAELEVGFTDATEGPTDLDILGTPNADDQFTVLRVDGRYSFFLEPFLDPAGWEDPETPETSTLAHEVALVVRGQYAFDDRLVPQYQEVAGGLFSVRGYKQAATAGDSLILGSAEYRLHVPRLLAPGGEPTEIPILGAFHARPRAVYAQPDWDFIVKVFTDAARVLQSRRVSSESNDTLVSVGGGVEMQLFRNVSVRVDAGHVLQTVGSSESGDTRGHLLATLAY